MYESIEEYDGRLADWEVRVPPAIEVKPKGNSMTQEYYIQKLLPYYLEELNRSKVTYRRAIFQEDNDLSYGTISNKSRKAPNVAKAFKDTNFIETMIHPTQSRDLNPQKALWGILFIRIRKREWKTLKELKTIVEDEWEKIDQSEIQKRIAEMPRRCCCDLGGAYTESSLVRVGFCRGVLSANQASVYWSQVTTAQALVKNEIVIEHEKRSRLPGKSTWLYRHDVMACSPCSLSHLVSK